MPHKVNPIDFENCEGILVKFRKFGIRKFINESFHE